MWMFDFRNRVGYAIRVTTSCLRLLLHIACGPQIHQAKSVENSTTYSACSYSFNILKPIHARPMFPHLLAIQLPRPNRSAFPSPSSSPLPHSLALTLSFSPPPQTNNSASLPHPQTHPPQLLPNLLSTPLNPTTPFTLRTAPPPLSPSFSPPPIISSFLARHLCTRSTLCFRSRSRTDAVSEHASSAAGEAESASRARRWSSQRAGVDAGSWRGGAGAWECEGTGLAKGSAVFADEEEAGGARKAEYCMRGPGRGGTMSIFHGSVGAEAGGDVALPGEGGEGYVVSDAALWCADAALWA